MIYQQGFSQYVVRSETNHRENNEDSFHVFTLVPTPEQPPIVVLTVADGMGGHAYGEHVSREALRKVSSTLFEELITEPSINQVEAVPRIDPKILSQTLMTAVEQTNVHVRRMVDANKWGKAGSTIIIAAILDNNAVVVNLGDSPLFHYQANSKQLTKITEDHTVAGTLLRAGMISPEMARVHDGRNRLEFYLGSEKLPQETPQYCLELASGDLLLLCSDGVSGAVMQEHMEKIMSDPQDDLEHIANRLLEASREAGEEDNQTLILWRHLTAPSTTTMPTAPDVSVVPRQDLSSSDVSNDPAIAMTEDRQMNAGVLNQRMNVQEERLAGYEQVFTEIQSRYDRLRSHCIQLQWGVVLVACLAVASLILIGILWFSLPHIPSPVTDDLL
jgi:protein phosphatase